jgi:uncharacterized protein
MEIRDPVHGAIEVTPQEAAVLDAPAFQRLRNIKQLGFGEFSYPGATHNRYLHSLGVFHLSGEVFDGVFRGFKFKRPETRWRWRQAVRLAALLHDIGHGPLSHTTEEVMPQRSLLRLPPEAGVFKEDRKATHEDYTIKFILDSDLTQILREQFVDLSPIHVAALIDVTIPLGDSFFIEEGIDARPILSQMVSSELDVDRMDYMLRDSYFCGTDYGKIELKWLVGNLGYHQIENRLHLSLSRRAIYTFDDFLISRHHMYLMVYFHHKAIIYDEMLQRYFTSPDCTYQIPADISAYIGFNDHHLYEHLKSSRNPWAKRISNRQPFRLLAEFHETSPSDRMKNLGERLQAQGIFSIHSSSVARLSKYHTSLTLGKGHRIYVIDPLDPGSKASPLEESTEIFQLYEKNRSIERIYVSPEDHSQAKLFI